MSVFCVLHNRQAQVSQVQKCALKVKEVRASNLAPGDHHAHKGSELLGDDRNEDVLPVAAVRAL
jgi:hypothetical protein